ncbi:hypothetical protein EDD17DRAFT_1561892 [Pisolithus thermaeus]|nr:hypothetical protein EDD17DRAFT_1561892 [Pisolithus thermaeus]
MVGHLSSTTYLCLSFPWRIFLSAYFSVLPACRAGPELFRDLRVQAAQIPWSQSEAHAHAHGDNVMAYAEKASLSHTRC